MTLRVVIADDEPPARARLRRLLADHAGIEVVAEAADGASAVQQIEAAAPDLVLLDIQMPELDGFEVLQALDMPRLPAIIFVSAFDQYALRAFRVHALDYVLKPVEPDRLDEALAHARARIAEQRHAGGRCRRHRVIGGAVAAADLSDARTGARRWPRAGGRPRRRRLDWRGG